MPPSAGFTPGPAMTPPGTPLNRLHIWQIQAVRDVLFILAVLGLIWAGYAMRAVTVPLLVALTLAYLFEPLIARLTRDWRVSRPVVVGSLIATVGIGLIVVLAIAVPLIIGQSVRLVQDVRAGRFQNTFTKLQQYVPTDYQGDYERALQWLGVPATRPQGPADAAATQPAPDTSTPSTPTHPGLLDEIHLRQIVREEIAAQNLSADSSPSTSWWDMARSGGERVFDLLGAIVALGLLAFLIPFYFFFFSVSYPAVAKFGRDMIPVANRPRALELIGKMDRAVAGFVRGRIVICFIMGVMLALGWMIVGVPYAIVLGFLIGAFSIVPYLGGIGIPLAVGLLAFDQLQMPEAQRMTWLGIIFWPCLVFAIVQVIETYALTPMIAGKATNLDPVTILVAVLAGGSVGGVYGMILAIPVAACLKILFTDVLLPKIRAWTKGEARDPLPLGDS